MDQKQRLLEALRRLKHLIKNDPRIRARYDLDEDGRISLKEWDLAREEVMDALARENRCARGSERQQPAPLPSDPTAPLTHRHGADFPEKNNVTSLWEHFCRVYFEGAVRVIAYCSTLLIFSISRIYVPISIYTEGAIVLYGIVCYGLIERMVAKIHKPKFVCEGQIPTPPSHGLPILKKRDYDYRLRMERFLYESGLFWLVNVTLGVLIALPKGRYENLFWGGICFIPAMLTTFVGLIFCSITDARTGRRPIMAYFLSPLLILPPIVCAWGTIWLQYVA